MNLASAACTTERCSSHLARWAAFGTDNVMVESVLPTKPAGAYTARAMPRNAGRMVFSQTSEVIAAGAGAATAVSGIAASDVG